MIKIIMSFTSALLNKLGIFIYMVFDVRQANTSDFGHTWMGPGIYLSFPSLSFSIGG